MFIAAPAGLIGNELPRARAREAAQKWMLLCWEVLGIRQSFADPVPKHNEAVWKAVCAAVPGPLFYFLISFTASKGFSVPKLFFLFYH